MSSETPRQIGIKFPPEITWSPIAQRAPLRWPNRAPLAVCVVLHVEHLEWLAPDVRQLPPSAVRRPPYPNLLDPHEVSPHEYGNRVGFFRLFDTVRALGLPASVAIDAASALRYKPIVERVKSAGWEFVAHGLNGTRLLTGDMPIEAERAYIAQTLDTIERATGTRPAGWAGVEYSESPRTIAALAEAGIAYTIDWSNDEQPFPLTTPNGTVMALPTSLELDDIYSIHMRRILTASWAGMVRDAVELLRSGSPDSGRLLVLNLHSWFSGQPFRMKHVRAALESFAAQPDVWVTTLGEVDRHFRASMPANGAR